MSTGPALRHWMLVAVVIVAGWAARAGGASVIALNPHDPFSLYLRGSATLDVGAGAVQVNSDDPAAAVFQGSLITLTAGEVNVVAPTFETVGSPALSVDINVSQLPVLDPLAGLPAPAVGSPVGPPKITGSGTFQPGHYPEGLELSADDNVILMPGVYVLDNGFAIEGVGSLQGQGVMFYIRSGAIQDSGGADVVLAPPTDGVYEGITFFQARDNTNTALLGGDTSYTGFGDVAGIGTLYLPAATLDLGGFSDMHVNGIIADKIVAHGLSLTKVIVPEPSAVGLVSLACAGLMRRTPGTRP